MAMVNFDCDSSAFFHAEKRVKDSGPTSLWKEAPQTYHCQESRSGRFRANVRRSRDNRRRVPYSSCGVMEIMQSLPGVMQTLAATVRQFKISSGVSSMFKPHQGPLLPFSKMDPS